MRESTRRLSQVGMRCAVGASMVALSMRPAQAADSADAAGAWRVLGEYGSAHQLRMGRLGVIYDWDSRLPLGSSLALFGFTEATLGRWQVRPPERYLRSGFTQFGLTPVMRLTAASRTGPYAELGIGGNVITPLYQSLNTRFGTVFNFGDHLGLGWRLPGRSGLELGIRFEHYSNAGIKKPNPGQNLFESRLSASF